MGGCTIKREGPVLVDGDECAVLSRDPASDEPEGWSVTVRPYRPKPTPELLRDLGTQTCLLAGNRVLMADGSLKPIEQVRVGEAVATMSGPAPVVEREITRLGMTRKMIELRGEGDECLILSDDHLLWTRRPTKDGTSHEGWGTYNLNHVLYEMRTMGGYELAEPPVPLNIDLPEQLAHVSGWLPVRPIYHHLPPQTTLYHLVVDGAFSYIAEGFACFSLSLAGEGPVTSWRGLKGVPTSQRSLELAAAD
jgi:hypothetical protein